MKEQRAVRGLTFAQLAAEVGYHPSYLSLVERGLRMVDEEGVVRLAQALELDPTVALLAALRERLPENLRSLVPTTIDNPSLETLHGAARQLQAGHFDYEVETLRVNASCDWDGNVRLLRTYEGCRPNASGRPVWEVSFREQLVGAEAGGGADLPKFDVRQAPANLDFQVSSGADGGWRIHRIFFPRGWRRSPHPREDSFSFAFEVRQPDALVLDASTAVQRAGHEGLQNPLQSSLSFHVPYFVRHLALAFDFPRPLEPERWDAWSWWGAGGMGNATRNLSGAGQCKSLSFTADGSHAELLVEEPLAGYSFAVVWTPADRQRYLEARYGAAEEPAS
jgi:transcriptional regulator with XRE-family HTH domain